MGVDTGGRNSGVTGSTHTSYNKSERVREEGGGKKDWQI